MTTKTLLLATLASVFTLTAVAPSFAAGDPVKQQKHFSRMIKRVDTNGDKRISRTEMSAALAKGFALLDTNRDGGVSQAELANRKAVFRAHVQQVKASGQRVSGVMAMPKRVVKRFAKVDRNGDGVISKAEAGKMADRLFTRRDRNKDGYISAADFNV
jgi:Ca2+-binding EF-hand superfamily protein